MAELVGGKNCKKSNGEIIRVKAKEFKGDKSTAYVAANTVCYDNLFTGSETVVNPPVDPYSITRTKPEIWFRSDADTITLVENSNDISRWSSIGSESSYYALGNVNQLPEIKRDLTINGARSTVISMPIGTDDPTDTGFFKFGKTYDEENGTFDLTNLADDFTLACTFYFNDTVDTGSGGYLILGDTTEGSSNSYLAFTYSNDTVPTWLPVIGQSGEGILFFNLSEGSEDFTPLLFQPNQWYYLILRRTGYVADPYEAGTYTLTINGTYYFAFIPESISVSGSFHFNTLFASTVTGSSMKKSLLSEFVIWKRALKNSEMQSVNRTWSEKFGVGTPQFLGDD